MTLRGHEGGRDERLESEVLMNEVFDLIRHRLPQIPERDPGRPGLLSLMPVLAECLERPLLVGVPQHREETFAVIDHYRWALP